MKIRRHLALPIPSHSLRRMAAAALLAGAMPWALAADSKASQFYEDALQRYEKKDLNGAVVQLKNALQADKNMLPVHVLLGKVLLANSDVGAAEVAFNEALRLGVNRAEVVVPLAKTVLAQGKRQALLDDPRFALTGLPPGVRAPLLLVLATAQADLGRQKDALKAIEEARAIEPTSPDSWTTEVPIRIRARQFTEAATAADKAVALSPGSAEAVYMRGSVAHAQNNLSAALGFYDKALALQPKHGEALLARAGIALDQNRTADAKRDIAEVRRALPQEPRGAYLGALIAEREGDGKGSKAALAEVTGLLDPVPMDFLRFRPQALILGGLSHYGLGSMEKAKPYFEMVQREQPASPVSKILAQIYLGESNVDRAIATLEGYLRGFPTDAQALSLLASAHMSQGRHARATQIMQDALKVQDTPQLRTLLGMSLVNGGKLSDATAELERAYARDPGQVQAGAALVSLHLRDKKYKKAADIAESLVKRQPNQPGLHNLLGQARLQGGDAARARAAFEQAIKLDAAFAEPRLNLARMDIAANQLDAAATRLNDILKADEKNVAALLEAGLLAERRGQKDVATKLLSKAADHGGTGQLEGGIALVDHHLRAGRIDAAQEAVKALNAKAPDDLIVIIANARVAIAAKNPEAARPHLVRAGRLANFDADMQTKIALLQMGAGDSKGAAYSLGKALQGDPGYLPAQALLTEAELHMGDAAAAEKRARDIVAQHPKAAVGHSLLGDIAANRGQMPVAIDAYRRAQQLEPSGAGVLRLHRAVEVKDPAAANQLAEQWLKTHPQDVAVRRAVADSQARSGNMSAAKASYEQLLKAAPDNAEALNNYAHVLLALKDTAGAGKAAAAALAAKPGAPHILGTAGWVALKSGQTDRALQLLRDARLRDPSNSNTRYYLAAALAEAGRTGEAREELKSALQAGTNFASAKDAQDLLKTLK